MARHFVRLPTMATITSLPRERSSMGALIGVLARAEEFKNIMLRRWVQATAARHDELQAPSPDQQHAPARPRRCITPCRGPPHMSGARPRLRCGRSEKKLLNTINHRPYSEGGCRFPVLEAAADPGQGVKERAGPAPRRVKARIQTAAEKIQILVCARSGNQRVWEAGRQKPGRHPWVRLHRSLAAPEGAAVVQR